MKTSRQKFLACNGKQNCHTAWRCYKQPVSKFRRPHPGISWMSGEDKDRRSEEKTAVYKNWYCFGLSEVKPLPLADINSSTYIWERRGRMIPFDEIKLTFMCHVNQLGVVSVAQQPWFRTGAFLRWCEMQQYWVREVEYFGDDHIRFLYDHQSEEPDQFMMRLRTAMLCAGGYVSVYLMPCECNTDLWACICRRRGCFEQNPYSMGEEIPGIFTGDKSLGGNQSETITQKDDMDSCIIIYTGGQERWQINIQWYY